MRTDPARRPALPDRLRAPLRAAGRRLAELGPRARWGLAAAGLVGLAALGYLATSEPVGYEWLMDGRPFTRAEAGKVAAALRAAAIPCVESGGRIGVPADRRADALAELARNKLGPRQLDDVLDELARSGSIFEDLSQRERRDLLERGRLLATAVSKLPGVVSATAVLSPVKSGGSLRPARRLRAMVWVQAEPGQPLSGQTQQLIRAHVWTMEPEVEPDGLTLIDPWAGHAYFIAGRPDVEALSAVKVREDELREAILEQLHIPGSRVFVRIDPPSGPAPAVDAPGAGLAVNAPLGRSTPPGEAAAPPAPGRAYVRVRIPRSYLTHLFRSLNPDDRPSAEGLRPFAARTSEEVRTVVRTVLAPGELDELDFQWSDDPSPAQPAPPSDSDARRVVAAWLPPMAAGALAAAALMALGGGLLAARRPARRPSRPSRRDPFEAGVGDDAGPSGRVRELIRLDPAAAAGVLHRWIAQGGPGA